MRCTHALDRFFSGIGRASTVALVGMSLGCAPTAPSPPNPPPNIESKTLAVTSISPNVAVIGETTFVRIRGTGFAAGAVVTLDGAATSVGVLSSTEITAISPGHAAGVVDVVVINPDGRSGRLAGGYTYVLPASPALWTFTDFGSSFSTTDLRDAQDQIVQFTTAGELIWTADGTRLTGYKVQSYPYPEGRLFFISGNICAGGCAFEVRFGTKDGERRGYLTIDYGHENPGTLVDVEVAGGALVVKQTDQFVPGTFTLSGTVTELTPAGLVPLEGAKVYRGVSSGWREGTTDKDGFYSIQGVYSGSDTVQTFKDGYQTTILRGVSIGGDTRLDIQLRR